jgi:UDP-glucose 4-epimerase
MRDLVLGGNGFIGTHLVDRLVADGHQVKVFDRDWSPFAPRHSTVDYRLYDFANRPELEKALRDIDVVYHLLGTTVPQTSNQNIILDVESNVVATVSLLEQCVGRGVKKLVYVSSGGTVYGRPIQLPVKESHPTDPECSYGITKLAVEKYLALFSRLHGLNYVILRPSNAYGERQDPNRRQGAIPAFFGKAARGEAIEIWGDGGVVRDYLYVGDLVDGIVRAARTTTTSRIINLGSGEGRSLKEIVALVGAIVGRPVPVNYGSARSFDIKEIYLDIGRALRELKWTPTTSLEVGMTKTWEFVKAIV